MELLITDLEIRVGGMELTGHLMVPEKSEALVIFSHGSGSSRFSPRNRYVSEMLNRRNIATLLTDLLTQEEDEDYENRFNIELLSQRLTGLTKQLKMLPETENHLFGFFGSSTGAASALNASADLPEHIGAVVLRGGRTDLAEEKIPEVKAPTLMIAGGLDQTIVELNRKSAKQMNCLNKLVIIEGAGHLFEEPGKLEKVSELAGDWYERFLFKNRD